MKTYLILALLFSVLDVFAQPLKSESQYYSGVNYLTNGGFEQGKKGWANTGGGTLAVTSANGAVDGVAGCVTLSSQTLTLENITTNNVANLKGNGHLDVEVYATVAGVQACTIVDNAEQDCVDIQNLSSWSNPVGLNFVFGATNYGVRLKTSGNVTGTVCADVSSIRKTYLNEVSQPQTSDIVFPTATNCSWTVTGTTSYTAFGVDSDCANSTQEGDARVATAPATKIPAVVLQPGYQVYDIVISGGLPYGSQSSSSSFFCGFSISDGTNTFPLSSAYDSGATGNVAGSITLAGRIRLASPLATATTYTVGVRPGSSGTSCYIENTANSNNGNMRVSVTAQPPASKTYSQRCADPRQCENVFGANIGSGGDITHNTFGWLSSCSTAATTLTCTYSAAMTAAITLPLVCTANAAGTSGGTQTRVTPVGTTSGFTFTTPAGGNTNGWSVVCMKTGVDAKSDDFITGTFEEMMRVAGLSKPKRCWIAFGGAGTLESPTTCTSSPCTVYASSPTSDCGTVSVTRTSAGVYNCIWPNGTYRSHSVAFFGGVTVNQTRIADATAGIGVNGEAQSQLLAETNTGTDTDSYGHCWVDAQSP